MIEEMQMIQLEDQIGNWLWIFSEKKKELFPYGQIVKCKQTTILLKTKEEATELNEMVELRKTKIENWLESEKAILKEEGYFVVIKEYVSTTRHL